MPLYEYECDACGCRFEQIQKFADAPLTTCAECGKGPVRRLLSSPAIQFKGAGWYVTDYSKRGSGAKDSGTAGTTKTESAPAASETKAESAPKADSKKD
ncbi:MAG: zinc ribbon domain-containing protein [SAR202 cluster bacterium]|nr:zinc ribbon domain-containing protein [SAR202 cluster bacterium]